MLHSGLRRWQGKPMHALETPCAARCPIGRRACAMRDDRQPFRLADLSLAAPLLPSLFMAVYGVMSQPSQRVLPVLFGIHAVCMAWAAATASRRAASRVDFGAAAGAVGGARARAPAVVAMLL